MLLGTRILNVDRKGRVVLPAAFRRTLGSPFILTRAPFGALFALSRPTWDSLMANNQDRAGFRMFFLTGAVEVAPDRTTGRVLVPCELREYSSIRRGRDVMLAGLGDGVLLSDRDRWNERLATAEQSVLLALGMPLHLP